MAHIHVERSGGFTLMEMAVVLTIMGAVVMAGSKGAVGVLETERWKQTNTRLDTVEEALALFVAQNKRLPCPDNGAAPTGLERRGANGTCADNQQNGTVPWVTLGLAPGASLDGWNRRISYRVWDGTTNTGLTRDSGMDMYLCRPGATVVLENSDTTIAPIANCVTTTGPTPTPGATPGTTHDRNGTTTVTTTTDSTTNTTTTTTTRITYTAPANFVEGKGFFIRDSTTSTTNIMAASWGNTTPSNGAAYVLISHGKNGRGAFMPNGAAADTQGATGDNEARNANGASAANFVSGTRSYIDAAPADTYDDIVRRPSILTVVTRAGLRPQS